MIVNCPNCKQTFTAVREGRPPKDYTTKELDLVIAMMRQGARATQIRDALYASRRLERPNMAEWAGRVSDSSIRRLVHRLKHATPAAPPALEATV